MSPKDKAILGHIYEKYCGTKKPRRDRKAEKVEKVLKGRKAAKTSHQEAPGKEISKEVGIVDQPKLGSRADLMKQAQQRGIKYFRILTKEELVMVLFPGNTEEECKEIINIAKKRWQAGWQKNKQAKPEPASATQ